MYNTFPISVSMDKPTLANLEALAEIHGMKKSPLIRQLINEAADALDGSDNGKRLIDTKAPYSTEAAS